MIQGYLNDKIKKLFITKHEVYDGKIKINAFEINISRTKYQKG